MENDPTQHLSPIDIFTSDEFFAREQALQALIVEAGEQEDFDKLSIFRESLEELLKSNPNRGTREDIQTNASIEATVDERNPEVEGTTHISREFWSGISVSRLWAHMRLSKIERERARKRSLAPSVTADDATIDSHTREGMKMLQALCDEDDRGLTIRFSR